MNSKSFFVTLICISVIMTIQAQEPFRFGRVSADDLNLAYYQEKYPDEPAVVIGDIGSTRFIHDNNTNALRMVFTREYRILILNESGQSLGDQSIVYYETPTGSEDIMRFRANIYTLDGRRVRTTRVNQRDGVLQDLGNNYKELVFALPDVRVGSLIEIRYDIISDFFFNLRHWYFQNVIPVEYSEYTLNLPSIFKYLARYRGFFNLDVNESSRSVETFRIQQSVQTYGQSHSAGSINVSLHSTNFRWIARNVSPLHIEPYTDNIFNYLAMMFFEMLSSQDVNGREVERIAESWEDVSTFLMKHKQFGEYLQRAPLASMALINDELPEDVSQRIDWALKRVRERLIWNNRYSMLTRSAPDEVINNQSGNSAEINLLLTALLRRVGINAWPVVTSTQSNGALFSDAPTYSQWNHIIVMAQTPGFERVLLDATNLVPVAGYLAPQVAHGRGRVIDTQLNEWVNLEQNIQFTRKQIIRATLDETGNLTGAIERTYEDFAKFSMLNSLPADRDREHGYWSNLAQETGAIFSDTQLQRNLQKDEPLKASALFEIPGFAQRLGDELLLPVTVFWSEKENPLRAEERLYPIFFPYLWEEQITFVVELPQNAHPVYIPENKLLRWTRFSQEISYKHEDNTLEIQFAFRRGARRVEANHYQRFKSLTDSFLQASSENIILKID